MYQLRLFGDNQLEGKPETCPGCWGNLRLAHPAFTFTTSHRGFYEAYCESCGRNYRLYRNREGDPDWELKSPRQDPSWCVEEKFN